MSSVRKPRFTSAKASTRNQGCAYQASDHLPVCHKTLLLPGMTSPQLVGHRFELRGLAQHGIVSMPLHKIRPAHERAVFRRASVVMPEIEIDKIDRLRERRSA